VITVQRTSALQLACVMCIQQTTRLTTCN